MTATCEVWFYHLERTALEQALPSLLERTLARNWRALVRTTAQGRLDHLDISLWSYRDEAFLPHGVEGEPHAERQPVLLTTGQQNTNAAQALFLIDGAEPGSLDGFERGLILFDGRDEAQLKHARTQWKALKDDGIAVSYWREDAERGWEKQA